jgi:hypothetical protein
MMHMSPPQAVPLAPVSQAAPSRGQWRKWLVLATLAWLVALYSIQVTHFRKTIKDAQACPQCEVQSVVVADFLKPQLPTVADVRQSSYMELQVFESLPVQISPDFKPQSRAPPILAS